MAIDLNALRDVVRQNQASRETRPAEPSRQVVVDRDGNVKLGDEISADEQTTQVPQETFAGINGRAGGCNVRAA